MALSIKLTLLSLSNTTRVQSSREFIRQIFINRRQIFKFGWRLDRAEIIVIRGKAQSAVAPTVIVCFLLLLLLLGPWGSMAALWWEHRKIMKFGTLADIAMNSYLTNFGINRNNSITPPPVQKFNIQMVILITHEPLYLEKWNLVHLITPIMLITCNSLQ